MRHCDKKAITINPTNQCNMSCRYCMAGAPKEQGKTIRIDLEYAKCGIRDALKGQPTGIKATILRFFSPGEPTQYMDAIKECVMYARSFQPELTIELQTNGLFECADDCMWIADNVNIVWISIDGPKEINAKYRPDENGCDRTEEIEDNLRYIQKKTFVGVRSTIVAETVDYQKDIVEHFHNMGIKYLFVNPEIKPVDRCGPALQDSLTCVNIMQFAEGFLQGYKRAKELGLFFGCSLTFNFDEKTTVSCRSCLPMPQLNPDGSVSSCDMAQYLDAPRGVRDFIYGKWNPVAKKIEYDLNKILHLQNRKLENLVKCKTCLVRENCAGGCAGRIGFQTGNIYDTIPEYCTATIYLARNMKLNEGVMQYTHP